MNNMNEEVEERGVEDTTDENEQPSCSSYPPASTTLNPAEFMSLLKQLSDDVKLLKQNDRTGKLPLICTSPEKITASKRKSLKPYRSQQQRETAAPQREIIAPQREIRTPQREIRTPQRGKNAPQRVDDDNDETDNDLVDNNDYDYDRLSLRASEDDESDDDETVANQQVHDNNVCENFFKNIKTVSTEDVRGPPIEKDWSKIINQNWESNTNKDTMKQLREQYPVPENCNLIVPRLNVELWQMLSSFQRKSDVKLAQIQRNLSASVAASLSIANKILTDNIDKKEIVQTTADITAMLGQATNEISQKRRLFVRSVLKDEYKDLTSITSETSELLFGDNLPQKIKDLNLRNKLKHKPSYSYSNKGGKPYSRPTYSRYASSNSQQNRSFLGRGRRSWNSSNNTNNNQQNNRKRR